MAPSSPSLEERPPQHQVFINFHGEDTRLGFVSHLVTALKNHSINVFIDNYEDRGKAIEILLTRIEESRIVLAVLSENYSKSTWCLRELAKIKDCVVENKLVAIPIFYKVEPSIVKHLSEKFGDLFRGLREDDARKKKQWEEALKWIPDQMGVKLDGKSDESDKIKEIVERVKIVLKKIPSEGRREASVDPSGSIDIRPSAGGEKDKTFGIKQRLKELGDMLDPRIYKGTRIIGVVGMPGIGKTTLLKELYKMWQGRFTKHKLIDQSHVWSYSLATELSKKQCKVLVVLDDISRREQIHALLGDYDLHEDHAWIKNGSRIIIATKDMSLINGLVHDTYVVQQLNHKDSLQLFFYHAIDEDQANPPKGDFKKVAEDFVQYAKGHPLALKLLSRELHGRDIKHWEEKLKLLAQDPSAYIRKVLQISYEELSSKQKDAFLDIAYFRSENVDYVESLLGSSAEVKALKNKLLINTCDGRVEMHDLLYNFSRELDKDGSRQRRLWLHKDIIKNGAVEILHNTLVPANVRGIFVDLSEVEGEACLSSDCFSKMNKLRYPKFYNSHCSQECKPKYKINIPEGLELPSKKVRCLHWLKFPLKKLPNNFDPTNLVDLRLPYSEIKRLWKGEKDTPRLKWVDLSHSIKLTTLSGLSQAQSLQRLNLEGCTSLISLRVKNLISLKTLILSGCSKFNEFPLVLENLEALYLDGTAINQLPGNMDKLQRLVSLDMKDCKMLTNVTTCVGEMKALKKLILSGCSQLKDFPEINNSSLDILLLDGTSIETMPQLSSVQYLCLGRNDKISSLPADINQFFQLTWLDLKCCTSITSIPVLPSNLQHLDLHGCSSLKTVAKPLAYIMPTVQNHCTFKFTNCVNLDQVAMAEIISYAQRKCELLSDAPKQYNEGLSSEALFSTCFPGSEVPSWFCHEGAGSQLKLKLLPHWHGKSLSGIALCAVVSFPEDKYQISSLAVACTFTIKVEDRSWIPLTFAVGSWISEGDEENKATPDHVFIAYISCPHTIRCLEDENSDKCNFTEASLEFSVTGGTSVIGKFTVLRCGLSLVYAKDKKENSSHEAKFDMPVEVTSTRDGGGKRTKTTRSDDDNRPKKKRRRQKG